MNLKRSLSILLSIIMILGICGFSAAADDAGVNAVKAYITVSRYGDIVCDKDGSAVALAEVELSDKTSYTLDDVFRAAHNLYYEGGSQSGYSSDTGDYGLYVTKFWGDESGNYGYQVNGGTESVMGLSHEVKNGDCIDVCIYKNYFPDTESYSCFDKVRSEVFVNEAAELTLKQAGYDENWNTVFSACEGAVVTVNGAETELVTDADGKVTLMFDTAGEYLVSAIKTKELNEQTVPAITAPVCSFTVKDYPDAKITVPSDTGIYVGLKGNKHFVSFTEMEPIIKTENGETDTYYFELEDNKTYNYRITSDDYVTYAGKFKKTADFSLSITDDMLKADGKTKKSIDRDTSSNNGYNVADIYLNINPQGYLKLNKNDTYQIVNLRNWEAVDSITANYFIEPDYHYSVINENGESSDNVVTVDENGLITAVGKGTAIVLVTYDAINIDFGSGADFYGALWPENTGVFVVSVDAEESSISTGMTINDGKNENEIKLSGDFIDSEHDIIYFVGESGTYTFTPETYGLTVSAANPAVDTALTYNGFETVKKNADGSFTVPLKNGRNIVKLEKNGKAEYQVITAKKVNVTVNGGEDVYAGDSLSIVFDTLYHPANKLAGVYNMNAVPIYTNVSGYENKFIGGLPTQYNFADNAKTQNIANVLKEKNTWGLISYEKDTELTVPDDYRYDTFTLSGGMIYVSGWGDSYGNHRAITYESGKGANLNADAKLAWLGRLPDIKIPVSATSAELDSISLDTADAKTNYYAGESFDKSGLTVTANYADGTTQLASEYKVYPEVLSADTQKVTITYRGKTAEIDVSVSVPKVTEIEVTSAPNKTSYKAGSTFDPTGMVVTAVYENGARKVTSDYSYSPNRVLDETDTAVTVTYTGDDKSDGLSSVTVPITVSASSGGGTSSSGTVTVYFTLYGDDIHGTPSDSSDTHTMAANNLKAWISKTKVTVDKGSYVIDAVAKALSVAGIPYTNEDNYISSIRGLKEFDNGSLSGWMYTLNGKYPNLGVAEQKLSNGDNIVLHYTDDYTQEQSSASGSSGGSGGGGTAAYNIKFETNGGSSVSSQSVIKNGTASKPSNPIKKGYSFEGWFTDKEFTKEYDFASKVTGDITLYAKWAESTEDNAGEEKAGLGEKIFNDVNEDDWYGEAVRYVYEKNLMQGTGSSFEPNGQMTRAMLVTAIYRMENPDGKYEKADFDDVSENAWYAQAVSWAADNKIVNGISKTEFAPNENVSREQMALIFYRYVEYKGYDTKIISDLSQFADRTEISDWSLDALKWANAAELINGTGSKTLSPKSTATRAQTAAMLMRFCKNIAE